MNTAKSEKSWVVFAGVVMAAWGLTGCVSNGYNKSEAAALSLQRAADEVQAEGRALDVTMLTLNELVNKPGSDLKFQFERFSVNLGQLEAAAKRNADALRRVSQRSAVYFEKWDREMAGINYEAVRLRSQARRAEVATQFDSVTSRYRETQSALLPLLDYLVDIRRALSTDLTLNGLESIKGVVENANGNATKIQTALGKLAEDLASSGTKMSSVLVQNTEQAR